MKMNSNNKTNTTRRSSEIFDEMPKDETSSVVPAPSYVVMEDEVSDEVFIPLPAPTTCEAHLLPTEGGRDETASNSGMTFVNGAADASSTKANPNSLDRHHGEKQLMTERDKMGEVIPGTTPSSKESVDDTLLFNEKNFTQRANQDQSAMDATADPVEFLDKAGIHYHDENSGDQESKTELEDFEVLCKEEENFGDSFPQQTSSKADEISENESCLVRDGDKTKYENICCFDESDFQQSRQTVDNEIFEKNPPTFPGFNAKDDNSESSGQPEFGKFNQNINRETISQSTLADVPAEVTSLTEGHAGSRFLDYSLLKFDCMKKDIDTTEMQRTHFSICKSSEEMAQQVHGSCKIATDIQQGEQLLERLQMVQLRHDKTTDAAQKIKEKTDEEEVNFRTDTEDKRREKSVTSEEEEEESELNTVKEEEAKTTMNNNNEEQVHSKTISLDKTNKKEDRSLPSQSETLLSLDLALDNLPEMSCTEIPFSAHPFSAAETSKENQILEAVQDKQNLQRAEGVFNLADNPDVLEIPFRTNLSLESLLTHVCTSQPSHWPFSGKKMEKEIRQEIHREQVLVNQGKIPGGYSKGEVCQLKETKLLFEAFQQDNSKCPTKHRKLPSSVIKGEVYPSVLERTRSLEMVSLKTCPVNRTHSLRLSNSATMSKDKSPEDLRTRSPENFRSKSPTGGSREKTRLSPYSKQDKHLRLHRSMDSISSEASTSALKTRDKTKEGDMKQESPIVRQNPFFKLRPALARQPEVQKDIQEAKEREEELRRQRYKLYGEFIQKSEDEEKSGCAQTLRSDVSQQSRGKLERVWPPPSKKDQKKSEHTQEVKVHRAGGQRALLWQRWESGLINDSALKEKK